MGGRAGKMILVVDDREDERAIQRAMLEHIGYQVEEAADGLAAVELARSTSPDLVLLDVAMPRMDGFAVCRALREEPQTAEIAVLFLTASPIAELEARVREIGGNAVLTKPVDPHEVAEAVRELIGPPEA